MHEKNGTHRLNGANCAHQGYLSQAEEAVVILGGGVAGLASGLELARRDRQVTILEQAGEVGGLARTVTHGDYRFDIGGHRFHSHNPRLLHWLRELLGDDLLRVSRRSHIYLQGQYVNYPLQIPGALGIFGPRRLLQVLGSFAAARRRQRAAAAVAVSFEDWIVQRFGRALYEIYFRPYTEKVWGIPCHELSADWAAQRISLPDLWATIRRALYAGRRPPATIITEFYYPRYGFGMIPERLAHALLNAGGKIVTNATVRSVTPVDGDYAGGYSVRYETKGDPGQICAGRVISTIPLNALLRALPPDPRAPADVGLDYRDLICVFLAIDQPRVSRDHWTYFPQRELIFGRTHEPKNWSEAMTPPGMTSLVAEIFTGRDEPTWQAADDAIGAETVAQLQALGILSGDRVIDRRVLRVKNAYPVYRLGYRNRLEQAHEYLKGFPNLHLVGRTGAFRYLNSDGVVEDALALVDWLCGQAPAQVEVGEHYFVP